jgi:PKD domain
MGRIILTSLAILFSLIIWEPLVQSAFAGDCIPNAGPDQTVESGATVTLDGSRSSDPRGHTLTDYRWDYVDSRITLNGQGTSHPTFIAPVVNTPTELMFELQVFDTFGGSALRDNVMVTILPSSTASTSSSFFGGPTQGGSPSTLSDNATKTTTSQPSESPSFPSLPNASDTIGFPPLGGASPATTPPTTPTTNGSSNIDQEGVLNSEPGEFRLGRMLYIIKYAAPESNGTIAGILMESNSNSNSTVEELDIITTTEPRFESLLESALMNNKTIGFTGQRESSPPPVVNQVIETLYGQPHLPFKIDTLASASY